MTRLFVATLGTETSTFASFPTGLSAFQDHLWVEGGSILDVTPSAASAAPQRWVQLGREAGWEVVEGLHARTQPSGPTTRVAYETMRDRILADLEAAGPVDAILFSLHGAMVAEGYDDCEGDLVARARALVGPSVRIGIELDLHAHIDNTLVDAADIIVFYKTYPHIDYAERAEEVFDLMRRTLAGEIDPVMALFDCRSMGLFPTTMAGPLPGFYADMAAAEGHDGILSLTLNHGFPWADVPLAGAKMIAVADGSMELAQQAAETWGRRFYRMRAEADLPFTPFAEAIEEAKVKGDKPLLLADTSDQIGSGAPGDTTHVLRALLKAGIGNAAIVPLWDPLAVGICHDVGAGTTLRLRIGGKFEPHSGPPLDATADIVMVQRDAWNPQLAGQKTSLGDIAVVRVSGIEILLTSKRTNVFTPEIFGLFGIDFAAKQVVSIKNLYKHADVFAPIVRKQFFVATPGASNPDWSALPFKRLPRPIWPFDPDPLGLDG